ncbi:MAG TPA: stage V sporulation protein AC [Clostridia bacterium]|nr:stage V sporulation protein AC [Clostridia bacterium]
MGRPQTPEQKRYQANVSKKMPKSKVLLQCVKAFVAGGIICTIGQLINDFGTYRLMLDEKDAAAFTAIVMVFLGATLTGIGVYDKIGSWAGAGSVVPITGFANSIVAPAMEFKREGYVMGVGAKLFSLAGPVLVYGISASIIIGLIVCIIAK